MNPKPDPGAPLNSDRLCEYCEKLEFALSNRREEKKYLLPPKPQIRANTTCPFCRLARWGGAEDIPDDGRQVYATWVPGRGFSISNACTLVFLDAGGATAPHGMGRYVQHTLHPALVNRWIRHCESHHDQACAPTPNVVATPENPAGIRILRMIDVRNQCIVEAGPGCRYVALSYMWGQAETVKLVAQNKAQLMAHAGLLAFRNRLPRTINDAIDLLYAMGEQYLWVDSICLLQDDPDEMGDAIGKMDLVYRGSVLTILAGAGSDANAGLPGVHFGSRRVGFHMEPYRNVLQYIEEVQPGIRMTAIRPLSNVLDTSQHLTRGWTMQEHVLSHRLLIFTDNRVFFRCHQNCWSEDTIYDDFPLEPNTPLSMTSGNEIPLVGETDAAPFATYASLILRYCTRRLTKETDTLSAVAGVLGVTAARLKCDMLAGLPTGAFDAAVLLFDAWPDQGRTVLRREGFPSWSWAGWRTPSAFVMARRPPKEVNRWLRAQTYIVWHTRDLRNGELSRVWDARAGEGRYGAVEGDDVGYGADGTLPYGRAESSRDIGFNESPLSEIDMGRIACGYPILQFWAYTVQFQAFEAPDARACLLGEYSNKIRGRGGELCGGIRFNDPKLFEGVEGPYECVLLSKAEGYENEFNDRDGNIFEAEKGKGIWWVMLIVWDGLVAERRGLGFIYEDCMEYLAPPGKVWKEVLLA